MTYEERIQILAKEALTLKDIAKLMSVSAYTAGNIMRAIKDKSDRLGISTVVHIADYIDAFNLPIDRYILDDEWKRYTRANAKAAIERQQVKK